MSFPKVIGKVSAEETAFLLCDIQEKFAKSIHHFETISKVAERLVNAAELLEIPVIATEQYPKGLGPLIPTLKKPHVKIFEKTFFSMKIPEVSDHLKNVRPNLKSIVLFGLESHVCVQQTALDFLEEGIEVHIIADGTSSRTLADRVVAFERMRQSGAVVTTHESILFMLMKDAKHSNFRAIQKLIIELLPNQDLVFSTLNGTESSAKL